MKVIDIKVLMNLVNIGHREYVVLNDYLKYVDNIKNIEDIEKEIVKLYSKAKDIYVVKCCNGYNKEINDLSYH